MKNIKDTAEMLRTQYETYQRLRKGKKHAEIVPVQKKRKK